MEKKLLVELLDNSRKVVSFINKEGIQHKDLVNIIGKSDGSFVVFYYK